MSLETQVRQRPVVEFRFKDALASERRLLPGTSLPKIRGQKALAVALRDLMEDSNTSIQELSGRTGIRLNDLKLILSDDPGVVGTPVESTVRSLVREMGYGARMQIYVALLTGRPEIDRRYEGLLAFLSIVRPVQHEDAIKIAAD